MRMRKAFFFSSIPLSCEELGLVVIARMVPGSAAGVGTTPRTSLSECVTTAPPARYTPEVRLIPERLFHGFFSLLAPGCDGAPGVAERPSLCQFTLRDNTEFPVGAPVRNSTEWTYGNGVETQKQRRAERMRRVLVY